MHTVIASSSKDAYSETFVASGVERLDGKVTHIYGRPFPSHLASGGSFYCRNNVSKGFYYLLSRGLGIDETRFYERAATRELKRLKPDCVLAHYGHTAVMLLKSCRKAGVPLVAHYHGYDAHKIERVEAWKDRYVEMGRYASRIIAVSYKMKEALVRIGLPEEKIEWVPCGVDTGQLQIANPEENPPTFFAVGRFVEKKGPYLSIVAFSRVLMKVPNAKMVMAGSGELYGVCRTLVDALGIQDSVEFTGPLGHDEVAERMRGARAFLQHSLVPQYGDAAGDSEGTPVAVLEASASGLPVISTRHAGIREAVIDGKTGLLVEEGDIEGMAENMLKVVAEPELAKRLGVAGRAHMVDRYSIERYIGDLNRIVTESAR